MHGEDLTALLDEIASALVLGDAADRDSLAALTPLLEQLVTMAEEAQDGAWIDRARDWRARLKAALQGSQRVAARAVQALTAHVSDIQTQTRPQRQRPEPDRSGAPAATRQEVQAGMFERPAWVEPEVLAEFLSEQDELGDAFEAEILALESDADGVAALRRRLHTLKGEAGVLGMDDLARVCHAIEDLLEDEHEPAARVDLLLELKDWIAGALAAYTEGRLPTPDATAIEQRLLGGVPQEGLGHGTGPDQCPEAAAGASADSEKQGAAVALRHTVKVDLERIDHLVELIGELVIAESMVVHAPEIGAVESPRVHSSLSQLGRITRELQDAGMRMRMVPLRGLFQKMVRLARDTGKRSGKQVRLELSGRGTEIDRSIVERIADPLMHIIRNAISHGIEEPQERRAAGKPEEGVISLSAHTEGGSIVIEVGDDGRGLDRSTILARARQLGLLDQGDGEERIGEQELSSLIFAPGFSTAGEVTEVAGRGVGLDVVKRSITAIRGRTAVSSVPGEGTTFRVILPLTLAIIDGMLVACGPERYIIPTLSVLESIQLTPAMMATCAGRAELVHVRGQTVPLLRLADLLAVPGAVEDPTRGLVVIVESVGHRLALLVDEVITRQQVVIKSLGAGIRHTRLISGGAILSDGRVGLILNVESLAGMIGRARGFGWEDEDPSDMTEAVAGSPSSTGTITATAKEAQR